MRIYFENSRSCLKKVKLFLLILCVLAILFGVLLRFKPVFQEKAIVLAKVRATQILNNAILEVFSGMNTEEYVNIITKDSGEVTSVTTDAVKMNKLKAEISKAISKSAESEDCYYVYIPIGSLTRFNVLQGMGCRIPVKVVLDSVTKTDFKEEFISSGINQVKSRIYIVASSKISIISSIMSVSEEVSSEIPISETIIVGDVPEYFGDKLGVIGR